MDETAMWSLCSTTLDMERHAHPEGGCMSLCRYMTIDPSMGIVSRHSKPVGEAIQIVVNVPSSTQ